MLIAYASNRLENYIQLILVSPLPRLRTGNNYERKLAVLCDKDVLRRMQFGINGGAVRLPEGSALY